MKREENETKKAWGSCSTQFQRQESNLTEQQRMICVVRTRLAYMLADVANTMLLNCESTYRQVGIGLRGNEKYRFKLMAECATRLRQLSREATKTMYELELDAYYEDSDRIYDLMMLLVDRCAGSEERFDMVHRALLRMRSVLGLYDKKGERQ